MQDTKQVIVMRRDLNMRKGKAGAQAAHASEAFITRQMQSQAEALIRQISDPHQTIDVTVRVSRVSLEWMLNSFAKVVLKVNDLAELMQIRDNAIRAGLEVNLIVDSGRTEFHGEATPTCIAIGPDYVDRIDPITKHLELW